MINNIPDNTINIYNTNIDNIIITKDSINIYSLYISINKYIYNYKRDLRKLVKDLDRAKGGPQDVQAQQYDKIGFGSNNIKDINDIYKQVSEISSKITELRTELNNLLKAKNEVEVTIREIAQIRQDNLECRVFIGYYIDKKSLKELSHELKRVNYKGYEQTYNYDYIRQVHVKLKDKIGKSNENSQFAVDNSQSNNL